MKKRKVMLAALSIMLSVGAFNATTVVSEASNYTQAQDAAEVNYGKLSNAQLKMAKAIFDAEYYALNNPDVVKALGTDSNALFEHFVKCGIWENREGNADFNPSAYASAYADLKEAFGEDVIKYYEHYYTVGKTEGRELTTLEACENAGVVVTPFFENTVDVEVYVAAELMGTTDYETVDLVIDYALDNGAAAVGTSEGEYIIASAKSKRFIAKNDPNYVKLGSISVNGDMECVIFVHKSKNGYSTSFAKDFDSISSDVVGYIPVISMDVRQGNNIIDTENYDIPRFETEDGVIIGSEGVSYAEGSYEPIYHIPYRFVAEHGKLMTNYIGGDVGYIDNAPIGIDEKGTVDTVYEVGTVSAYDEEGNACITAVITNKDISFNYEVTYMFEAAKPSAGKKDEDVSETMEVADLVSESKVAEVAEVEVSLEVEEVAEADTEVEAEAVELEDKAETDAESEQAAELEETAEVE